MENQQYTVRTRFTFTGEFIVKAKSEEQAKAIVANCCGMIAGDIHTNNPSVTDWNFPVHPDKDILNGKA